MAFCLVEAAGLAATCGVRLVQGARLPGTLSGTVAAVCLLHCCGSSGTTWCGCQEQVGGLSKTRRCVFGAGWLFSWDMVAVCLVQQPPKPPPCSRLTATMYMYQTNVHPVPDIHTMFQTNQRHVQTATMCQTNHHAVTVQTAAHTGAAPCTKRTTIMYLYPPTVYQTNHHHVPDVHSPCSSTL